MNSRNKMMCWLNSHLSGFYQYVHLIFGLRNSQVINPSAETLKISGELFQLLKSRQEKQDDPTCGLTEAKWLISDCQEFYLLAYLMNANGYNILQLAVMNSDEDFIKLLVEKGFDVNAGQCSLPLHVACKMGNQPLVKLLLKHGASAVQKGGMCFPGNHIPVQHIPSRFHFLETDIYACDGSHEFPVMYAIQHDKVEVVKCLLDSQAMTSYVWPRNLQLLHYACKHGAYNCIRYLITVFPSERNGLDEYGMTPFLYAVHWGKKFIELLEGSGSNVMAVNANGQSALHLLFASIKDPLELYECTRFLLACGLEQEVNTADRHGNTALHILVDRINRRLEKEVGHADLQKEYDRQALQTMEVLLRNNCDPDLLNDSGVTVLHKLILTFDFVVSSDPSGITLETLPVRENYKIDMEIIYRTFKILLTSGADPSLATGAGRTPLVILLGCITDVEPAKSVVYSSGLLECLRLLCTFGAHPSHTPATHATVVAILAHYGHQCLLQREDGLREQMSQFLEQLLTLLLQNGLDSNHSSKRAGICNSDSKTGNILVELVRLAQFVHVPCDLVHIHRWVLTCLQWGANPDVEPYPSDHIICHSQSNIFLKPKGSQPFNQYMYHIQDLIQPLEGEGEARRVLMLFYDSMGHGALYQCLNAATFMSRFDPECHRMPSSVFVQIIKKLAFRPRSLKQNARVAIYRALNRQLSLSVPLLPLPNQLKSYLLNVE